MGETKNKPKESIPKGVEVNSFSKVYASTEEARQAILSKPNEVIALIRCISFNRKVYQGPSPTDEDVNNIYIHLLEKINKYNCKNCITTYITNIMYYYSLNRVKKYLDYKKNLKNYKTYLRDSYRPSFEASFEEIDNKDLMESIKNRLGEKNWNLCKDRILEGKTLKDISETSDTNISKTFVDYKVLIDKLSRIVSLD